MPTPSSDQWERVSESIKAHTEAHTGEVMGLVAELQPLLHSLYPLNLTLVAALYCLAMSGAATILKQPAVAPAPEPE